MTGEEQRKDRKSRKLLHRNRNHAPLPRHSDRPEPRSDLRRIRRVSPIAFPPPPLVNFVPSRCYRSPSCSSASSPPSSNNPSRPLLHPPSPHPDFRVISPISLFLIPLPHFRVFRVFRGLNLRVPAPNDFIPFASFRPFRCSIPPPQSQTPSRTSCLRGASVPHPATPPHARSFT